MVLHDNYCYYDDDYNTSNNNNDNNTFIHLALILHFFLLRTSKILPSLNVLILRAYFRLKCSYFVLICSSCHKCFTM